MAIQMLALIVLQPAHPTSSGCQVLLREVLMVGKGAFSTVALGN